MAEKSTYEDKTVKRVVKALSSQYNDWDTLKNANEYMLSNPEFSSKVIKSIDRCIKIYNETDITNWKQEDQEMYHNITARKKELPQIKSINEIITDMKNNRYSNAETFKEFIQTTKTMFDLMNKGKEFIKDNPTNTIEANLKADSKINDMLVFQEFNEYSKESIALGEIIHAYEIFSSQAGMKKDWMTDILLETCVLDKANNPLFEMFKEMGWYDGYDHLSPELRQSIGAK